MRKFIVPIAMLALAACSAKTDDAAAPERMDGCSYNIPDNTKTCQLSKEERAELASTLSTEGDPVPVGRTTYNNNPYTVMSDGTLKPEK